MTKSEQTAAARLLRTRGFYEAADYVEAYKSAPRRSVKKKDSSADKRDDDRPAD